jgi:mRNA interferase MazF
MLRGKTTFNRGDVWSVDLEPTKGSEPNKVRPCLVVSNNAANRKAPLLTVVAITSSSPPQAYPFMVEIPETARMPKQPSWIHCGHIRVISKHRVGRYFTSLDSATMRRVDEALMIHLGIDAKLLRDSA